MSKKRKKLLTTCVGYWGVTRKLCEAEKRRIELQAELKNLEAIIESMRTSRKIQRKLRFRNLKQMGYFKREATDEPDSNSTRFGNKRS